MEVYSRHCQVVFELSRTGFREMSLCGLSDVWGSCFICCAGEIQLMLADFENVKSNQNSDSHVSWPAVKY